MGGFCVASVVLRERRPAARGVQMWGGLRRPFGPFWGSCVLALAVLTAVLSISPSLAQNNRNRWVPEKPGFNGNLERANSNTITIVSGSLDSTDLSIAS